MISFNFYFSVSLETDNFQISIFFLNRVCQISRLNWSMRFPSLIIYLPPPPLSPVYHAEISIKQHRPDLIKIKRKISEIWTEAFVSISRNKMVHAAKKKHGRLPFKTLFVASRYDFPLPRYRRLNPSVIFLRLSLSLSLTSSVGPHARSPSHWPIPRPALVRWSLTDAQSAVFFPPPRGLILLLLLLRGAGGGREVGHAISGNFGRHSRRPVRSFERRISETNWDIGMEQIVN